MRPPTFLEFLPTRPPAEQPFLRRAFPGFLRDPGDSGIIDQNVDGPKMFERLLGRGLNRAGIGYLLPAIVPEFHLEYWMAGLLVLAFMFFSRRGFAGVEPLDDISPVSNSRKLLYIFALFMLVLTFAYSPF